MQKKESEKENVLKSVIRFWCSCFGGNLESVRQRISQD